MKISITKCTNRLIEVCLITILLLSFNSVYLREWTGTALKNTSGIWLASIIIMAGYFFINIGKFLSVLKKRRTIYSLGIYYGIYLLVYLFVKKTGPSLTTFMRFYGLFIPLAIIFFGMQRTNDFLKLLEKSIFTLMIISSILWLIGPVCGLIKPTGQKSVYWGQYRNYEEYFKLCFTYYRGTMNLLGKEILKNTSIFTEAPMSGMIFTLGFALYISLSDTRSKLVMCIYMLCILTTGSTTSIILTVLIYVWISFKDKILDCVRKYHGSKAYYLIFLIGLVGIVIFGAIFVKYMLMQKAITSTNSYNDHFSDFFDGIELFKNYLIAGAGMGSSLIYVNYTSGMVRVLSQGGILFFLLYAIPFIALFKFGISDKKGNNIIWITVLFIQFILVICQDTLLFLFLLAFGYSVLMNHDYSE